MPRFRCTRRRPELAAPSPPAPPAPPVPGCPFAPVAPPAPPPNAPLPPLPPPPPKARFVEIKLFLMVSEPAPFMMPPPLATVPLTPAPPGLPTAPPPDPFTPFPLSIPKATLFSRRHIRERNLGPLVHEPTAGDKGAAVLDRQSADRHVAAEDVEHTIEVIAVDDRHAGALPLDRDATVNIQIPSSRVVFAGTRNRERDRARRKDDRVGIGFGIRRLDSRSQRDVARGVLARLQVDRHRVEQAVHMKRAGCLRGTPVFESWERPNDPPPCFTWLPINEARHRTAPS